MSQIIFNAAEKDGKLLLSDSIVFGKALRTTGKTVGTTGAKTMTHQVLKSNSTPQVHCRSVMSNHGPTT